MRESGINHPKVTMEVIKTAYKYTEEKRDVSFPTHGWERNQKAKPEDERFH
jgi:outer membrane translocation and assembly module TamA